MKSNCKKRYEMINRSENMKKLSMENEGNHETKAVWNDKIKS